MLQVLLFSVTAYAATTDTSSIYGDYVYFDENGGCGNVPATPVSSGSSVYILGDSITVRTAEPYKTGFEEKAMTTTISAVSGRSWKTAGNASGGAVGTQGPANTAVDTDAAAIKAAGVIVIALGTNGFMSNNPIEEIITKIRSINGTSPIWWVNTANASGPVAEYNGLLDGAATAGKIKVIPWSQTVDPGGDGTHNPKGVLDDGTHPSVPDGVNLLASQVVTAITTGVAPTTAPVVNAGSACQCKGSLSGSGTLPDSVPAPYHDIFIAAGSKHNVSPAAISAIFFKGEQGSSWPDPPPPYGTGPMWASRAEPGLVGRDPPWSAEYLAPGSKNVGLVGSVGSSQFIGGTWLTHKDDGDGDGKFNAEDLTDASFGLAKLLVALGGTKDADDTALQAAFARYNGGGPAAAAYGQRVMEYYRQLLSEGAGSGISGNSGNPSCGSAVSSSEKGAKLVETAFIYAWREQKPQGANRKEDAKPEYQRDMPVLNGSTGYDEWSDCGVFISTVIAASGLDPSYPKRFTPTMILYVKANPDKYDIIENVTSSDQMQPGDIIINSHHIMMFVGTQPEGFNTVDASQGDRVAGAKTFAPHPSGEPYMVARMK